MTGPAVRGDGFPGAWVLADTTNLQWRHWDGELVVMVQATGSTHLLSGVGAAVFLTLHDTRGTAITLDQLEDWLSGTGNSDSRDGNDEAAGGEVAAALRTTLLEFVRIGLATQITP